jgi:sulfur-oxidizing protein SoxY
MNRRSFFAGLGVLVALPPRVRAQEAHVSAIDPLVWSFTKGREVRPGKVTLELPARAESGHSVAMTVKVASPMTENDYVKAIHLISEINPVRDMATFYLGPRAGRAEVSSRVRLNGTQRVVAVAEMSDGTFWSGAARIEVMQPACTEGN